MVYSKICEAVEDLKNKYGENDPFMLCRCMGIILLFQHLGNDEHAVKGFYMETSRVQCITVNDDLPLIMQKIIVAHELGHAVLHRSRGIYAFHDVSVFEQNSDMEKEANLFAAEYLLDDGRVLDTLNQDTTFFSAAASLMVPMELLDFKFRVLKWKGYKLTGSPICARSNFLRDIEVPYNDDNHIC